MGETGGADRLAELRLSYAPEEFYTHGELAGVVRSGGFAGEGSAWFNVDQLRDVFLPALRAFPVSSPNLPSLTGDVREGRADFGLKVSPFGTAGKLLVEAELQSNLGDTHRPVLQYVQARFWTEYAELARFAVQFRICSTIRGPSPP